MSFSDWLLMGGLALYLHYGTLKADATHTTDSGEHEPSREELERARAINAKRREMPCFFNDGLSSDTFRMFAHSAASSIKRIRTITIKGAIVYCNVNSQSGCSEWEFSVDFNNWGHVTGTYWTQTDNNDSSIPHHYGSMVSGLINDFYQEHGIHLKDLSDYVDENKDLETPHGLNYTYEENLISRIFRGNNKSLTIEYGTDDLVGEHLYPVISQLRNTGFKKIKTFSVKDINDYSGGFYYQVEQVLIAGSNYFAQGMCFLDNVDVLITYHEKQMISIPFSESELKRRSNFEVRDLLQKMGFSQVHEIKIRNLFTGLLIKKGTILKILLDENEAKRIRKGSAYPFDQKITIYYYE